MFFEKEFVVDSRSVDVSRQCRPSALLGYLQEAATLASLEFHASGPEIFEKYNCLWMVTRIWAELDRPLVWNQPFTVRTWHRGAAGASTLRDFDILAEGKAVGQAVSTWVMVEADTRTLYRMKGLPEFEHSGGGELCKTLKPRRLSLPETWDSREERVMRWSETDINGHINNVRYADFACDALHLERLDGGHFVREFQIDYVGECRPGETLLIDTAAREDGLFARGEGQDGSQRFEYGMKLADL